jgi:hypothetical protein
MFEASESEASEVVHLQSSRHASKFIAHLVPSHAEVLELQGTAGTSCFRQRLFLARLVGLIFMQAME